MAIPLLVIFAVSFFAGLIATVTGFGASMLLLPLALFLYPPVEALLLVALFHLVLDVSKVVLFREGFENNLFLWFGVPAVIFAILFAFLVPYVPTDLFKKLFGAFLIGFVLVLRFRPEFKRVKTTHLVGAGALSGMFAGLLGSGGAVRLAALVPAHMRKETYLVTLAFISMMMDIPRIFIYARTVTVDLALVLLLAASALLSSYIGSKIVTKVNAHQFRSLVLIAIFVAGVAFLVT